MKHNSDGHKAEEEVSEYLAKQGYIIVDRNWKTPKCEIDIVAQKDKCIYFVEVKFRSTHSQGSGFEYITSTKLKQMAYAAETWVLSHKWRGEYALSGASVSGNEFSIEFIEVL